MYRADRVELANDNANVESCPPEINHQGLFVLPYIVFHKAFKYGRQGFRHDFDVLNGKHLAFIQFDRTHQVVDFPLNIQLILLTIPGVELTDRQGHSQ